jgi:NADP-dependent 3-hydroxy acid dehydrogenase YdfG
MSSLKDKVAVVTGASKGIGRAIGEAFGREGCHVVLAARNRDDLSATVADMRAKGYDVLGIPADVGVESDVSRLMAEAARITGTIDIVVNNAGMGIFKNVVDTTTAEFDTMWNTNLRGAYLVTREALPHMIRAKRGEVVFINSLAGKNSIKGGATYAATKWAMRGFASSLMLEVREHNIRVVTVFPGSVETSFSASGKKGSHVPQPEDVASAVLFAVTAPGRAMFSEIDLRPTRPGG